MLSFSQYCNQQWSPPIPKVLFGIHSYRLEEEFKDIEDYMFHIGKDPLQVQPWSYIGDGVHEHKASMYDDDGIYQHVDGTKFKNMESALMYGRAKKQRYLKNLNNLHNELSGKFDYSERQGDALGNYVASSKSLNLNLLHGKELNMSHHATMKHLEDVFSENKAHKDLIVYSGTNNDHANKLRIHDIVEHPSYLSTSIDPSKAAAFARDKGGDMIKIHVPAGHPAAYVGHISEHPGERELILPKGLKLKIHEDKRLYHNGSNGSILVHHATLENE